MAIGLSEDDLRREADKCQHILNMTQTPGWATLTDHFNNILQVIQDKLLTEKRPDEILRLQERYHAFECMLEAASTYVALRDVYERELQEIAKERVFAQRYAINN